MSQVGFGKNVVAIKDLCKTVSLFQAKEPELRSMIERITKLQGTVAGQAKTKQMKGDVRTVEAAVGIMFQVLSRTPVQALIGILAEAVECPICDAAAPRTSFEVLMTRIEDAEKLDFTWVGEILVQRGKEQANAVQDHKSATQLRDELMEFFTWSMQFRWAEDSPLSDERHSVFDSLVKSGSKRWSELGMDVGRFEIVEAMLCKFKTIVQSSQSKRTSIAVTALTELVNHVKRCGLTDIHSITFSDAEAGVAQYLGSITGARLQTDLQEAFHAFSQLVASLLRVR